MNTGKVNDPKGEAGSKKCPLGLIPASAMEQQAWVHKSGADKYGAYNWRATGVCASTYVHAIMRHLNAWRDGEDLDPESGMSHLAHVACCANIVIDAAKCGTLDDDRIGLVEDEVTYKDLTGAGDAGEINRPIAVGLGDIERSLEVNSPYPMLTNTKI